MKKRGKEVYSDEKVGPTFLCPRTLYREVLLSGCAKNAVQRGYSVLTVPPLGFEGLSETLIMFNYL